MEKVPLTWNFLAKINIASEIIQVLLRTTSEHLSLACSHFLIGKKWQLKPTNYRGKMFIFYLELKPWTGGPPWSPLQTWGYPQTAPIKKPESPNE